MLQIAQKTTLLQIPIFLSVNAVIDLATVCLGIRFTQYTKQKYAIKQNVQVFILDYESSVFYAREMALWFGDALHNENVNEDEVISLVFAGTMRENVDFDISQWVYRAEGNSSLVVANVKNKTVLRLLKHCDSKNGKTKQINYAGQHKRIKLTFQYVERVVSPLLHCAFIKTGVIVELKKDFVENVNCRFLQNRPASRQFKEVDVDCPYTLCLPDFCFLPPFTCQSSSILHKGAPTFSVEIKPKQGYMICRPSDEESVTLRENVCRYCRLQPYKVKLGKQKVVNGYCPLDLFSGNTKSMKHALKELFKVPQNNLRIFQDGKVIMSSECHNDLENLLKSHFGCGAGQSAAREDSHIDSFITLLVKCLLLVPRSQTTKSQTSLPSANHPVTSLTCQNRVHRSHTDDLEHCHHSEVTWSLPHGCVLSQILAAQMLCDLDIESLYPHYERISSYLSQHPDERSRLCIDGPYDAGVWDPSGTRLTDSPDLNESLHKVRDYLVAATFKDCSIMIAVQPCEKESVGDLSVLVESGEQHFAVSISVIDLDPKSFDNIPKYLKQDRDINAYYHEWSQDQSGDSSNPHNDTTIREMNSTGST